MLWIQVRIDRKLIFQKHYHNVKRFRSRFVGPGICPNFAVSKERANNYGLFELTNSLFVLLQGLYTTFVGIRDIQINPVCCI